jgi:hypothetical protein
MRFTRIILAIACGATLLITSPALAQQTDQGQGSGTIPAYRPPLGGAPDASVTDGNGDQTTQSNQPLSGVQNLSLGLESTRSYWQPHVDVTGSADSNSIETPHGNDWRNWISFSGGVDLHHAARNSETILSYLGGGMFTVGNSSADANSGVNNGVTQSLDFSQKYAFRRSALVILEQLTYLPESSFGFGGAGGATLPGGLSGGGGLQFGPGQSVLTGRGQNLDETTAVELDHSVSRRSSITMSGGYSILHYFDSPLFNYGLVNARGGYNYQISRKDTIAADYTYASYVYSGSNGSFQSHTIQGSYGRVINGELAFQVSGGPQEVSSQSTALTEGGTGTSAYSRWLWSLNSALQYQKRRYALSASYSHGVSGGSGVLIGSENDSATGTVTRQMSRTFSSGFTGGYSRNAGLPQAGAVSGQKYDYWFGGLNLTKPIGPTLGLSLTYQVQYQTSTSSVCAGPSCGGPVLRHFISVGLGWHERPLLF